MLTSLPAVAFLLVVFSSSPISVGFLIGKGTAVLCPIVSTCLMPLLKVDEKFTLLGFALVFFYSPNICFSSFYHLPAPFQKIHKRFLVTHGAMIFLLIKNYRAETAGICFMQAVMWLLSFVAIHEFSSVYWADLRLREDFLNFDYEEEQDIPGAEADYDFPVVEQEPEIQNDGQNIEDHNLEAPHELLRNMEQLIKTPSGCECKICLVEYSTTRIPRMLSGCGHTICEKCAGQLLKNGSTSFITFYKASRSIRCPFCREGTVVRGSVQQMPKNYELMKVIGI
ncbi:hypothetical protein GCK72_011328 [Caenorhabditis remanei]|uniref:RING-type domain-containing protein n=1 Tax=Caenorhabditis remanei TaxID=31234 RepID=A0A6A5H9F7_CAERE|nr:hypothetical protein GCK72_011328 [Caenorhabditis remanei]KAF1763063.1 hypothetical protein GCK72_011328 [Caenorhabditis remanei]